MEQPSLSKDLELRQPTTLAKRSKPTLMTLDTGHTVSSDGRWHPELAADYLQRQGHERWIPTGELAKVFYHANMPRNKGRVRHRMKLLERDLIGRNELLVRELSGRRVVAVKLYNPASETDEIGMRDHLERLRQRKELTEAEFHRAICVLERKALPA